MQQKFDVSNIFGNFVRFRAAAASGTPQQRVAHVFQCEPDRSHTTCESSFKPLKEPTFKPQTHGEREARSEKIADPKIQYVLVIYCASKTPLKHMYATRYTINDEYCLQ